MKVTKKIENMKTKINNVETTIKNKLKKAKQNSSTVTENRKDVNLKIKSVKMPSEDEPVLKKKKKNKNKNKVANNNGIIKSDQPKIETNDTVSIKKTIPKKGKISPKTQNSNETEKVKENSNKRKLDESCEEKTLSKKGTKKRKNQSANSGNNHNDNSEKDKLFSINGVKIFASIDGNDVKFNVEFAHNNYMTKYKDLFVKSEAVADLKAYRKSFKSQGLSKPEITEKLGEKEKVFHSEMMVELFKNLLNKCKSSNRDDLIPSLKKNIEEIESEFCSQDSETSNEDEGSEAFNEDEDEGSEASNEDEGGDEDEDEGSEASNEDEGGEASNEDEEAASGSDDENSDNCFCCNKKGHTYKDCPKKPKCFYCGSENHLREHCPERSNVEVCFNCNEKGHRRKDCSRKLKCYYCESESHLMNDCPDRSKVAEKKGRRCFICNKFGHIARSCPTVPFK